MLPNPDFLSLPHQFWADVRTIGQAIGYKVRGQDRIRIPTPDDISECYSRAELSASHLVDNGSWTDEGEVLEAYMIYRAQVLEHKVKSSLMNADQARLLYESTRDRLKPIHEPPMNKQRGEKRQVAYLTALVNMHIEHELSGRFNCDYNPLRLTSIIRDNRPLRTLARRMDGAFPSVINPIAVWEIKEYYHTTTFGSRVADGIYAALFDR